MRRLLCVLAILATLTAPTLAATPDTLAVDSRGDSLTITIQAEGWAGSVDDVTDLLGPNGRHLYVAEQRHHGERFYLDLANHSRYEYVGEDTHRVVVDLESVDGLGTRQGDSPPAGAYEVNLVVAGGPSADFFEEGHAPGDRNFGHTWSTAHIDEWQYRWNPYLPRSDQVWITETVRLGVDATPTTTAPPTTTTTVTDTPTPTTTATPTAEATATATTVPTAPPTTTVDPGPPPETYEPTPEDSGPAIPSEVLIGGAIALVLAVIVVLVVLGAASGRR